MKTILFIFLINLFFTFTYSQTITVNGKIKNTATNKDLEYANISVQNTNYGTVSNLDGSYILSLDSASYILKVSYIGYESKYVKINSSDKKLNIFLNPLTYHLEDVVVSSLTWIEKFILKAIEEKNIQKEKLINYKADAYSKTLFRFKKKNKSIIGGIFESISQISFEQPDFYKEKLLTYKPPPHIKNLPYDVIAINQNINFLNEYSQMENFYIVNPLNNDALEYYEYKLKRKELLDKDTIVVVEMKPRVSDKPLFKGELIFNQRTLNIVEVKLKGNDELKDGSRDSLVLFQKYSVKDSLFNLPSFTKFSFLMNAGFLFKIEQEYTFINYAINIEDNKMFISNSIPLFEENDLASNIEYKRNNFFKIPLILEEQKHINKIDTLFNKGPLYKRFLIKTYMFLFSDALILYSDEPANIFGLNINRFSNWYHFNKVEGHYIGGEYNLINNEKINLYVNAGYGFSSKYLSSQVRFKWKNLELNLSRGITNLNNLQYNKSGQTFNALFYHTDDMCYYKSNSLNLNYTFLVTSKIKIIPSLTFEKQLPIKSFSEFSLFYRAKKYSPNLEIEKYNNHKAGIAFEYIENENYRTGRPIIVKGRSLTNFSASYKFGSKKLFGSTENRSVWNLNLQRYQEIYNPISLDVRMFLHYQNHTDYIQELDFVNRTQITSLKEAPLSFYTLKNYEYQLQNYLKIKSDLTLFELPKILDFQMSLGFVYSFLRPLNKSNFTEIKVLESNFHEYGIALKGISFLNFYLLKNNLSEKDIFFRVDISL
ncbi:MAG: carboxypeptidase-like regulatory domain-containing protein [Arcobacter sp.]|nr:carboxypeptidase-like regulatory domain-containing protein [Arcobacter sp.]